MRRFGLGMVILLMLCGPAFASDPERVCGDFEVFKSPDAVRYVGQFEQNKRPYTIVIAEQLENDRALVFYVYGKKPDRENDREGCVIRIARFKEKGLLFMSFRSTISLTLRLNEASTEWTRRDRDGHVKERLTGSLKKQIASAQHRVRRPRGREDPPGPTSTTRRAATPTGSVAGPPPVRVIREAQELLAALGYKPGPADGLWGRRTAKAYGAFLRDARLPPSDALTPEGIRAMRAVARRQPVGTRKGFAQRAESRQRIATVPRRPVLHRTVKAGDIDGLKAALKGGAKIDARDGQGWTALMHAANRGYKLMVRPLLAARADVNKQAADGATALFMAVVRGHGEIIEMLVKAGADIWLKGPQGKTALDVAVVRGDPDIVRTLIGDVFKDCAECPDMVVIPPGEYMMGSPGHERGRDGDEGPQHRVRIGRLIAVGKYEVTFEEWDACVTDGGCRGYRPSDQEWGRGRRPVINVSWEDAKAYVRWLKEKTGKGYRLLTEAEWEYAARAGTETRYAWGDAVGRNRANCDGCGSRWDEEKTAPVGSFGANGYGLHDMHGNVWEWVEDCQHVNYHGAPEDGRAWTTGGDCSIRVLRGGSWVNPPRNLRSALRSRSGAVFRSLRNGFRVARTLAR